VNTTVDRNTNVTPIHLSKIYNGRPRRHNHERFIEQALNGVAGQDCRRQGRETGVVLDGSTDAERYRMNRRRSPVHFAKESVASETHA
jgi:hypothetical protein